MPCQNNATFNAQLKACKCNSDGWKLTTTDISGADLAYITCSKCPGNSYNSPKTPWTCSNCADPVMVYNYRNNLCECPPTHKMVGSTCIPLVDF